MSFRCPVTEISASAGSSERVNESFLNGERRRKTAEQFANEFECGFGSPHRNVFEEEWLERRFVGDIPMFDECSGADLRYAQQLVGHAQLIIEKNGTGQVVDEMLAAGTGHDVKKLDYS